MGGVSEAQPTGDLYRHPLRPDLNRERGQPKPAPSPPLPPLCIRGATKLSGGLRLRLAVPPLGTGGQPDHPLLEVGGHVAQRRALRPGAADNDAAAEIQQLADAADFLANILVRPRGRQPLQAEVDPEGDPAGQSFASGPRSTVVAGT